MKNCSWNRKEGFLLLFYEKIGKGLEKFCSVRYVNISPMSVTLLTIHADFVGERTNVRFSENTLLEGTNSFKLD